MEIDKHEGLITEKRKELVKLMRRSKKLKCALVALKESDDEDAELEDEM